MKSVPVPMSKSATSPRPSSHSSARQPPYSAPRPSQQAPAASSWTPPGVYATHLPANDPRSIEDDTMDQQGEISEDSEFEPLQDSVPLPHTP